MADMKVFVDELNEGFSGKLSLSEDGMAICSDKSNLLALLRLMKEKYSYEMLLDISAVEYPENFEIVYHLLRLADADIAGIRVQLPKGSPSLPSAIGIWKNADVMEREEYDLMGIIFENHGNLTRILCPDDFEGHPLRKDFKLDIPDRF